MCAGNSREDSEIAFARFCFRGERREDWEREYFDAYYALDERVGRLADLQDGELVPVSSLYTVEEKRTSVAYNELLPRWETQNGLNVCLDGPAGSRIVLTLADPVRRDGWSAGRLRMIESLLPHLRLFVRLRQALVDAQVFGSSLAALLDGMGSGVFGLDGSGRIVSANARACQFLSEGGSLTEVDGFLHAASEEEDAALQRVLAGAMPPIGCAAASGSTTVGTAAGRRVLLHATPTRKAGGGALQPRIAVLVQAVDLERRPRVDPAVAAHALGLTAAESEIAALLAEGRTVRDVAAATGRGESTVRWHVKHIYAKQGLSRQAELIRLLQPLTDIYGKSVGLQRPSVAESRNHRGEAP